MNYYSIARQKHTTKKKMIKFTSFINIPII